MADKKVNSILSKNNTERNETLKNNKGKYNGYIQPLGVTIGSAYDVYSSEKSENNKLQHVDILRYTHNDKTEFSKELHNHYGVDVNALKYYSHFSIQPSYRFNDYEGYSDYISYMWETYGREMSYAGHIMGLLGVRELAENLAYDMVPDIKGKTASDVINEILQYTDVKYALEGDRVGIVKDINVAMALKGVVTTNINNYSGKETKMGLITNRMYASTLLNAANLNSLRRTKYITPELETIYGNNLNNVYNLSSLFSINDETGRIPDPITEHYIGLQIPEGNVFDYLKTVIPEFKLPENGYDWSTHQNYGPNGEMYFDVYKAPDGFYNSSYDNNNENKTGFSNSLKVNQLKTHYVYSEGDNENSLISLTTQNTSDNFAVSPIVVEKESLLKKTNEFLRKRKINTMVSRFHNVLDKDNNITQSSVFENIGISHGRNLLNKESWKTGKAVGITNGYSNPYCRVWTNHHQYSKLKDLIRPFIEDETFLSIEELQKEWGSFRSHKGAERLSQFGVLNKNGLVNITPTTGDNSVDIKNCMFSIENLAWKDVLGDKKGRYKNENGEIKIDDEPTLSEEQRGPNGGRIMWFPPYDLNFQETSSAKWSENEFIGRGEPVYTYVNSNRSGTLEFTLLVDHPSILNYWLMDKKNNATEDDEQALLRFFAGCETLTPSEDIYKILDNQKNLHTNDPQETPEEKDIVFYTFFPNNYSGKDETSPSAAMDMLFGGYIGEINLNGESTNDFFLGYEMGVNPISVNKFDIEQTVRNESYYLDTVCGYSLAETKFGDLSKFNIDESIKFSKKEDLILQTYGKEDDKIKYYYTDYEKLIQEYQDGDEADSLYEFRKEELTNEIQQLESERDELVSKINSYKDELKEFSEEEKVTSAYNALLYEISLLEKEEETLTAAINNKNLNLEIADVGQEMNEALQNAYFEITNIIEDIFVPKSEYSCTKPIYVCYNFQGEEVALKDESKWKYDDPISAYAEYKAQTLTTYFTNNKTDKPFELLNEKKNVACKTRYGKDGVSYWVIKLINNSRDIPYIEFSNKRKFIKSNFDFGKNKTNTEWYVKFAGETHVFKNKTSADNFIISNEIIPVITEKEFREKDLLYGTIGNGSNKVYMYYDIKEISESEVVSEFINALNKEVEGVDNKDKYIIDKYYSNHKFGSLNEMGFGLNYGVIQLFFTGKLQDVGESYETVQDFIARHDILRNSGKSYNENTKLYDVSSSGNTKYLSEEKKDKKTTVTGEIYWDVDEPKLSYPIDKGKEKEKISGKNHFDMTSFGLNSTYEVVKKEMGDNDITFSFGEVYAALHGEKEKKFVLSCERGVLKTVLKYEGEELENKVKEAEDRINYLKTVFNPIDGVAKLKVSSAETWGTASSDGTQSKNTELAKNREKTIQGFLKNIPIMKDIEVSTSKDKLSNSIIDVSKTAPKEINNIISKKAKHSRVAIVVGDKDIIETQTTLTDEKTEKIKDEKKIRLTRRYDNERLFFELLKENDQIAYKRLVDKVKYFSPAFHSLTPEGFNARLTFLQQCTRQGPTSTSSDISTGTTASNLAFGRAPFCVLRLGDFLNTKIVITSVNITYPDSMWDLNPEGIGVQFMMAKVTMQINIIGGSDISAPIKRLQNAVSFNYYANTSIYDNRSDNAKYVNNEIVTTKQWHPQTVFDKIRGNED